MGRLTDNLAALKTAMNQLFTLTGTVATSKRKTAGTADKTKKVGGKDVSQLAAEVRKAADDHAALQGNVHNDTFTSVGIHSKATWDALEPTLMPKGVLPISRYGSQNYLPPGIQGSFEGGTTGLEGASTAVMLEDDGTAVYLRNGTDGARQGVFYAFLEGATQKIAQPTRTGRRYQPSWFPAGTTALFVLASSQSVIVGQLQDAAGVPGDYFVALTNGTYDASKHTGGIIPKAAGEAMGINAGCETFVAGSVVYFLRLYSTTNMAQPYDIFLWSMPLATLAAAGGANIAFTQITGITTVGFGGVSYAAMDRMRFAAKIVSQDAADKPIVRQIGTDFSFLQIFYYYTGTPVSAYDEVSKKFRTKIYHTSRMVTTAGAPYSPTGFSFTYDPTTKTARLDPFFDAENTVTGNQPTPVYDGPLFDGGALDKLVSTGPYKRNYAFDEYGNVWMFHISNLVDNLAVYYGAVTNFTTKYAALEYGVAAISSKGVVAVRPSFGTAIGSGLFACVFQARDKFFLHADGVTQAGAWRRGMVKTTLVGDPTYVYESLYRGSIKGYEPSPVRQSFADLGLSEEDFKASVNEVSSAGSYLTHTQRFIAAKTGITTLNRLTGRKSISVDLNLGAEVTCTDAILQGLGNQINTKLITAGQAATTEFVIELVVPIGNGVPPFAIMMGLTTAKGGYVVLCPVTVTKDAAGNIIGATAETPHTPYFPYPSTANSIQMNTNGLLYCGPVAMYDMGTDVFIGISTPGYMGVPGGSPSANLALRYNKATGQFVHNASYAYRSYNVFSGGTGRHYVAHDVHGFGVCFNTQGAGGYSDETTKLNFMPLAKTVAEFDAITGTSLPADTTWICLASQKAAEGWVLYFSEETPVVIGGYYFVLPVSNIDLRSIVADASNKTFYVYVRMTGNTAAYVVATSQTAESSTNMLVATVTTSDTQIVSITAEKVSRIGTFRISVTSKGSAIPVSTGLPSSSDKLAWS